MSDDKNKYVSKANMTSILDVVKKYVDNKSTTSGDNSNITIDSANNLMTITDKDGVKYYSNIFSGISAPTISYTSQSVVYGSGCTVTLNAVESGAATYYRVSASELSESEQKNYTSYTNGTSISFTSSDLTSISNVKHIYAYNLKNGLYSDVYHCQYTIKLKPEVTNTSGKSDYDSSRVYTVTAYNGYTIKYSSNGTSWSESSLTISGVASSINSNILTLSSSKSATATFYVRYENGTDYSDSIKISNIAISKPQIYYRSCDDLPSSLTSLSGWTAHGVSWNATKVKLDKESDKSYPFYPCFLVPKAYKTHYANCLTSDNQLLDTNTVEITYPTNGNDYILYYIDGQNLVCTLDNVNIYA